MTDTSSEKKKRQRRSPEDIAADYAARAARISWRPAREACDALAEAEAIVRHVEGEPLIALTSNEARALVAEANGALKAAHAALYAEIPEAAK
jgi:hypothetical protein